jgi:predicted metal-dependent phosphoesterase TrpH
VVLAAPVAEPGTAGRSFADLHCHSSASFDSLSSPEALIRNARRFGLTHLAITDHERIDGALRARDLASAQPAASDEPRLTVIVGEEIRTTGGDLIGLFLERAVPPGRTPEATAAAIHEQGGLVGIPHPFDRFRNSGGHAAELEGTLTRLAQCVDFVEIHNARAVGNANPKAAEFAVRDGLPGVAASDAHSVFEVGVAYSVFPEPFATAEELKLLLPHASLVTGRASYFVRLLTPVYKLVNRTRGNVRFTSETFGTEASS